MAKPDRAMLDPDLQMLAEASVSLENDTDDFIAAQTSALILLVQTSREIRDELHQLNEHLPDIVAMLAERRESP